jgi:4-hydroxy-tetrahydrodipicolinate synthase
MTAMITPYTADGAVNYAYARSLARHLVQTGNEGLVVTGTTGEAPLVADEEKYRLWEEVKQEVGPDVTVVAGAGTNDTRHSIELTRIAERAGADMILAVAPYYLRPPQEGLYQHFKAIAESTSLPVIVYNVPSRTGVNLTAEIPNIVGDKEANGDLTQTAEVMRQAPGFRIWSGNDSDNFHLWCLGAYGAISVTGHLTAGIQQRMFGHVRSGQVNEAADIHRSLLAVTRACFMNGNPSSIRYALRQFGFEIGLPRLPVVEPESAIGERIMEILRSAPLDLPDEPVVAPAHAGAPQPA